MATFRFQYVISCFGMKIQRSLNYFQGNYLIKLKFGRERTIFGLEFKFIQNFHV